MKQGERKMSMEVPEEKDKGHFTKEEREEILQSIRNKKKKRYSTKQFLEDYNSPEPNNVKAVTKAIIAGSKVFVKESPHPFVGFLKETAREIFS